MLDVLETRIVKFKATGKQQGGQGSVGLLSPDTMRAQLENAGLSRGEFEELFEVAYDTCQDWLNGKGPAPVWIQPALQMLSLLSATKRNQLMSTPKPLAPRSNMAAEPHPFSRLEEL